MQKLVTRRHRLGVPQGAIERVARLAAHIFEAESGLVTFIGTDRQLNVACAGHVPEDVSLEVSFCVRAIRRHDHHRPLSVRPT